MRYLLLLLACSSMLLSGCAAVVVGGAAVGAISVREDPRSVGMQIDDTTNASKIDDALDQDTELKEYAHINVHVYNNAALLVGQAPTQTLIIRAENLAKQAVPVKKLHNQIRIGNPTATTTRAHDVWLKSKVMGALLANEKANPLRIDVIVEDSAVYLMGIVSQEQARLVVDIVRNVNGVVKVYNIFEVA